MSTSERSIKRKYQRQRTKIINQVNQLTDKYCNKCPDVRNRGNVDLKDICNECPINVYFSKLYKDLSEIAIEKRSALEKCREEITK